MSLMMAGRKFTKFMALISDAFRDSVDFRRTSMQLLIKTEFGSAHKFKMLKMLEKKL
jgi:hypothetical protein